MKINYKSFVKGKKCGHHAITQDKEYGVLYVRKDGVFLLLGDDGYHVIDKEWKDSNAGNSAYFTNITTLEDAEIIEEKGDRMLRCWICGNKDDISYHRVNAFILHETDEYYYITYPEQHVICIIRKYTEILSD